MEPATSNEILNPYFNPDKVATVPNLLMKEPPPPFSPKERDAATAPRGGNNKEEDSESTKLETRTAIKGRMDEIDAEVKNVSDNEQRQMLMDEKADLEDEYWELNYAHNDISASREMGLSDENFDETKQTESVVSPVVEKWDPTRAFSTKEEMEEEMLRVRNEIGALNKIGVDYYYQGEDKKGRKTFEEIGSLIHYYDKLERDHKEIGKDTNKEDMVEVVKELADEKEEPVTEIEMSKPEEAVSPEPEKPDDGRPKTLPEQIVEEDLSNIDLEKLVNDHSVFSKEEYEEANKKLEELLAKEPSPLSINYVKDVLQLAQDFRKNKVTDYMEYRKTNHKSGEPGTWTKELQDRGRELEKSLDMIKDSLDELLSRTEGRFEDSQKYGLIENYALALKALTKIDKELLGPDNNSAPTYYEEEVKKQQEKIDEISQKLNS